MSLRASEGLLAMRSSKGKLLAPCRGSMRVLSSKLSARRDHEDLVLTFSVMAAQF